MLFVPLSDDNPVRFVRYQWATVSIIAVNVAIYLLQASGLLVAVWTHLSIVPSDIVFQLRALHSRTEGLIDVALLQRMLSFLSYMFVHVDLLHLASNMIFLWVFGDNVEDGMGHVRYLVFYLACGVIAALTHVVMHPISQSPLVGASGAVSGTIVAYLILHPRASVWVLAFRVIPLRITAIWILSIWILTQVFMALIMPGDAVAWWAHIGGLLAGAVLVLLMRRRDVPILEQSGSHIDGDHAAWWREYRAALFHRSTLRLAKPLKFAQALGRYVRRLLTKCSAMIELRTKHVASLLVAKRQSAADSTGPQSGSDVLKLERRGANFALVRKRHDGSRLDLELTAINVVHLGLLAPGFAREVLDECVGKAARTSGHFWRDKVSLKAVELVVGVLDRGGERLDWPATEDRTRALALRLMARADRMAAGKIGTEKANLP